MAFTIIGKPPGNLFRYRSASTSYYRDEIQKALERQIFVAPYGNQNDPFEASPSLIQASDHDLYNFVRSQRRIFGPDSLLTGTRLRDLMPRKVARRRFRQAFPDIRTMVRKHRSSVPKLISYIKTDHCIASFAMVGDSQLMWSHYADSHTGFALEYEFDDFPITQGSKRAPIKVRYSDARPEISDLDVIKFATASKSQEPGEDRVFNALWLTKSTEWAYEQEWRLIEHKSSGYVYVPSLRLARIVVGCRVTPASMRSIAEVTADKVPISRIRLDDKTFSLVIESI